jgi:hypothetical protein
MVVFRKIRNCGRNVVVAGSRVFGVFILSTLLVADSM